MTATAAPPIAPAPARPDPMPAGRLGMWLFLASEAMFFTGLLGGYVVLLSAVGQRPLFHASAAVLSKPVGVAQVLLLVAGSLATAALVRGVRRAGAAVVLLALLYLAAQGWEYRHLLRHHTVAARLGDDLALYDGTTTRTPDGGLSVVGLRARLPDGYDVHRVAPATIADATAGTFAVPAAAVLQDATYGPARNNYLASYVLLTAVHVAHVAAGLAVMLWLLSRRPRPAAAAVGNVGLYWQFVNGVGVVTLLALYLA